MKKDRKVQLITIAVLLLALGVGMTRFNGVARQPGPQTAQDPQDTIYNMLRAARAGDIREYLASYQGPMEASLRQALAETTGPEFEKYLRDSHAAIKGIALSDPQWITALEVRVRVEYVYQDRNEAQVMYLEKGPNGWRISRTERGEQVKTLVQYGTPVK